MQGLDWGSLGIDAGIIAAIVGMTQGFKVMVLRRKKVRWLILVPVVLGVLAALVKADAMTLRAVGELALKYAGLSVAAYSAGKVVAGK